MAKKKTKKMIGGAELMEFLEPGLKKRTEKDIEEWLAEEKRIHEDCRKTGQPCTCDDWSQEGGGD